MSIAIKQNFIYVLLVIMTSSGSIALYFSLHQDWILFREAENQYENKEYQSAIDLYKKSLEKGLPPSTVNLNYANSYVALGRFEEAALLYKEYLKFYPKDNKVRLALAKTLMWMGKYSEAEAEYEKILEK